MPTEHFLKDPDLLHLPRVGVDGDLVALDFGGKILWQREVPRPRLEQYQATNSPASPSPVTDGQSVYVFFGDFGLISYRLDGEERWRLPLGPFNNMNGHGSSPILVDDLLVVLCDQDTDSYLLAVDNETGRVRWKITTGAYTPPVKVKPQTACGL